MRVAALVIASLGLVFAAAASGAEPKYLAQYCSQTGDLCYGIIRLESSGRILFRITTQARYFPRYRLCVKPPTGALKCRNLPINRQARLYGSNVYWRRNFGDHGPGVYRVTWSQNGTRLGPTLRFTQR